MNVTKLNLDALLIPTWIGAAALVVIACAVLFQISEAQSDKAAARDAIEAMQESFRMITNPPKPTTKRSR